MDSESDQECPRCPAVDEDGCSSSERSDGDLSDDGRISQAVASGDLNGDCLSVTYSSAAVASDAPVGPGHHLQHVPSPSNPVHPIGGSVSTDTAEVSKRAADNQIIELVEAFVRRGEETSFDATVETRADSKKEVHVHLTQTNIHNPAAVALGGQVVVNPPQNKTEPADIPRPPTEMQKLRFETENIFEKWTEGMVMTRATQTVLDKISQGKTWITIIGSPGEGKTTAGYLVLKHLHRMGRQVYDIKTPGEYFKVKLDNNSVLMLNDIFGSLHFIQDKIGRWEDVLSDVLSMKEHQRDDEMDVRDRKKAQLTVILISRSSVLKAASHHLGRFRDLVLKEECTVDLTHGLEIAAEERMKIWKCNSKGYNIDISDKIIKEVCQMSLPHGFPHCCRLFAAMYTKNKNLNMKSFFSKPLEFLNQTMESLMMDAVTGPLLREMLKYDGSLHLDSVTDDERRFQYSSVVEMLGGTYLSQNIDKITFHHPSVYDSAAFVVCKKDPLFVVKHCSLKFLNERVVFSGMESGLHKEIEHIVEINNRYIPVFLERLKLEYEKRNLSLILSHPSFHDENFVSKFMQCILPSSEVQPLSDSVRDLIHTRDKMSGASFLFLMTKSQSDKILKYVCQNVEISSDELTDTLFGICEHSSVPSLEYFLRTQRNFDLNTKDSNSQTPLLLASTKNSGNLLKCLLNTEASINAVDMKGKSALHNICRYGMAVDGVVVKMMVQKGADVNRKSLEYPYLPLHIACIEGHSNLVIALIECGADVDMKSVFGYTPLILACWMNHVDTVKILLDRGADINRTDRLGRSPLHSACYHGHVDIVIALLDRGADINKTDIHEDTPLRCACYNGHFNVMTILLDRGADINDTNSDGNTSLYRACYKGHVDVVTVLLNRGADINQMNCYGSTPLHAACDQNKVDAVKLLLKNGADIDKTNNGGYTPLRMACDRNNVSSVTVLLDKGADINKKTSHGYTVLHSTCYHGYANLVTLLLDRGADINKASSSGETPLQTASGYHKPLVDVVKVLLDRGADINMTNIYGDTPLHKACDTGHVEVVRLLLDRGADMKIKNRNGVTPLTMALSMRHMDVVNILGEESARRRIKE